MKIGLSSDRLSTIQMSMIAYWKIRARLLRVPGVANVPIWGGKGSAPDRDVRDAGDAEQTGPDLPVGDHRHLDRRQTIRRQADLHHPARGRERLDEEWRTRPGREVGRDDCDPLLHLPSGLEQVRPVLEDHDDLGVLRHRLRSHHVEMRNAVERLLERHGDELLDLRRREADRGCLDLHLGRGELREDVDLRLRQLDGPHDEQGHGEGDDDVPEPQALPDDPTHHGRRRPRSVQVRPPTISIVSTRSPSRPRTARPSRWSRPRPPPRDRR